MEPILEPILWATAVDISRYNPSTLVWRKGKWYVQVTKPVELQYGSDKQSRRSTGTSDKHPQFKGVLNTGQALRLMNIDSQIANMVLDYFTNMNIPVLCIHDSFIIQYDKEPELRRILDQATHQVTNYTINHDIKNLRNTDTGKVTGNIKGYEEPAVVEYHTPIRIDPSSQYLDRKIKFTKWLELSGKNLS